MVETARNLSNLEYGHLVCVWFVRLEQLFSPGVCYVIICATILVAQVIN